MLTAEMTGRLNDQLNLEFFSANLYLQMSAWCSDKGFGGCRFLPEDAFTRRDAAYAASV
ncbi:Probable ferritin-1 [Pantoea agglomerans]|uniref:Probable ferritin-1 n=1 Tax=Enterobacter agglomerans TaxID=549 RepID=A0A379AB30_ENTAG|nr:Probable ferritin-1 [Pantoea agglomerans]